MAKPLSKRDRITVRAVFLGQRINMKALEQTQRVAVSPFVMETGSDGYAALFRYGVAVLFGLNAIEEASFINNLQNFVISPYEKPAVEEVTVAINSEGSEGAEPEFVRMHDMEVDKVQLLADVMAKAVVLSHHEARMADTFDAIDPIAAELQSGRPSGKRTLDLMRHIGTTLSIQRTMVGQVQIEEKPDVLWERPDLERLYAKLEDELEIIERHNALRHKLDLVYKTAETILGVLQERRTLHVEWYIVALILFEIVLTLTEKIFHI